jgi:O-antigen/teichoic acid export membrane protein
METSTLEQNSPPRDPVKRTLAQSMSKGTIFGVLANLVRYGTRLVLIPIIIAHLGLGGYGIWATLLVIAGYLRFGSSGIKATFQKYVAEAMGKGEFERANQLVTTGTIIFIGISAAVLIPAAIFSRFVAHVVGIPAQYMQASTIAITVMAIAYLISNGFAVFESAVLGAHRVDLMQYFTMIFMVFDLVFCIVALRLGYGLAALAVGMALSEVGYAVCGFLVARRVVPQISLRLKYLTTEVLRELVRFSGSYQLLNIMELFYVGVVPIVLLRELGANAVGVFAICDRLTRVMTLGLESSLVPLLSGSTTIFAGGSSARMRTFLSKVFKLCLILTVLPLSFAVVFGPPAVLAWTGQINPLFRYGILLVCLTSFFRSLAKVGMVMYRSTGAASMDIVAQLLRIVVLLLVIVLGKRWGFYGALSGLALAEFGGMVFMLEMLFRKLHCFGLPRLFSEAAHVSISALLVVGVGKILEVVSLHFHTASRMFVSVQLSVISIVVLALVWPTFILTNYLSPDDRTQILKMVLPSRRTVARAH